MSSHTLFNGRSGHRGNLISCPQCSSTNPKINGTLTVNGAQHDAYKCQNCNNDFSAITEGVQDLVKALIDHPSLAGKDLSVGFTSTGTTDASALNGNYNSNYGVNNYGQQEQSIRISNPAPDYNYKFDNISGSIYSVQTELQQLTLLMRGIVAEMKTMAEQNRNLMAKMADDPLIHIRKQVSEFNLE